MKYFILIIFCGISSSLFAQDFKIEYAENQNCLIGCEDYIRFRIYNNTLEDHWFTTFGFYWLGPNIKDEDGCVLRSPIKSEPRFKTEFLYIKALSYKDFYYSIKYESTKYMFENNKSYIFNFTYQNLGDEKKRTKVKTFIGEIKLPAKKFKFISR